MDGWIDAMDAMRYMDATAANTTPHINLMRKRLRMFSSHQRCHDMFYGIPVNTSILPSSKNVVMRHDFR